MQSNCLTEAPGDAQRLEADIPALCVQNHAANLMPLPNGDLACVWFGGTQEGVPDISIYFSRLAKDSSCWTIPVKLSDDPSRSEQNPVLFPAPDGKLWLLYTSQKSGNQDNLRHSLSHLRRQRPDLGRNQHAVRQGGAPSYVSR